MYLVQSVTSPWEESKAGAGKYTLVFFHNRLEFALTAIWRIRFWGLSVILKENPRELHGLTYHTLAVLWTTPGFSFISSYCRRTESALSSACLQAGCPTRCTGLCLVSSSPNGNAAVQRCDLQLRKMLREISMPYLKTFCLAAKESWSVVWGCA